ncbi:hypothetical protein HCN44_009699 [Aphidius gifuensis]|uniref:AAA-ATPase-like domain-containing protein n=1 Tax=Aphidius gifuensis TaxID=684658 RepID=A0A834Y561_APHGI|nr:hypothetical protein HCN44_009699 [Aphidius gifuensis]
MLKLKQVINKLCHISLRNFTKISVPNYSLPLQYQRPICNIKVPRFWLSTVPDMSSKDDNLINQVNDNTVQKNFNQLIGATNIKKIIKSGYYVDKTEYMKILIDGEGSYFLVRPRRFGKSIMLDTLSEICNGEDSKELFTNTYIGKSEYQWKKYCVFRFDFAQIDNRSAKIFEQELIEMIQTNCNKYKIKYGEYNRIARLLDVMINGGVNLNNGYEPDVIILIDEYDSPMEDCSEKKQILKVMSIFFKKLKASNGIRLTLVTGATRFGLSDIFTSANHLTDITLNERVNAICGFTEEELKTVFEDKITELSRVLKKDKEDVLKQLKVYYNGYRFNKRSKDTVFNAWSVLQCFDNNDIISYWPGKCLSLYHDIIMKDAESISLMMKNPSFFASSTELNFDKELDQISLKSLLFQTGYLTIKEYDEENKIYTLSVPNKEVETLLKEMIANDSFFINVKEKKSILLEALKSEDMVLYINCLRSHYSTWPYFTKNE